MTFVRHQDQIKQSSNMKIMITLIWKEIIVRINKGNVAT